MALFDNPFDPKTRLRSGCSCGQHDSPSAHDRAGALQCVADGEERYRTVVASAVMRAVFPGDLTRRAFSRQRRRRNGACGA